MSAIYLVRHGQASFGAQDYDKLSPLGIEQSRHLGATLASCGLKDPLFVSGSMRRHHETLEECLLAWRVNAEPEVDEGWNEFDHLHLIRAAAPEYADPAALRSALSAQSNPKAAFQHLFEKAMVRWASGEHDVDYVETWDQFHQRVDQSLSQLFQKLPHDRDAVVVTSGGPIASIIQSLLQVPVSKSIALNWTLVNTGYTRVLTGKNGPRLCSLNVHVHLYGNPNLISYR
ncbi:histidine phosphatase family protein [Massilia sp. YIM B04103]|uniref:histidine phosphatase family protein n=1 Tax=Massilia sp. YIM B04103 TaxID=2963106 RepID=UPI00210E789F|nr:histidine phosphatase family protein [Massilia sp. YIM B04103]